MEENSGVGGKDGLNKEVGKKIEIEIGIAIEIENSSDPDNRPNLVADFGFDLQRHLRFAPSISNSTKIEFTIGSPLSSGGG